MIQFSFSDYVAFCWFVTCWAGFTFYADYSPMKTRSISFLIQAQRKRWMKNMIGRELRMIDTLIQSNLITGVAFFASTSLLLVGGMLAFLGATDKAVAMLRDLPFAVSVSRDVWEAKVLFLVLIFIYSFFKFAWCHRLFQYCSIALGAAPMEGPEISDRGNIYVSRCASLHDLAGLHFIRGLRAYFFALAGLAWFAHAWLFMLATTWVTVVLYRREFRSQSHTLLQDLSKVA